MKRPAELPVPLNLWNPWSSRNGWKLDAQKRFWQMGKRLRLNYLLWFQRKHTVIVLGKRKPTTERIAVFFQGFSRKQVNTCTEQKMKQYFLEWAKCHSNRWQKCRHAREQVYELMHGHVFCPGMLKQQLLENYFKCYIYRTVSLPA